MSNAARDEDAASGDGVDDFLAGMPLAHLTQCLTMRLYGSTLRRAGHYLVQESPQFPTHSLGRALFLPASAAGEAPQVTLEAYARELPGDRPPVLGPLAAPEAALWADTPVPYAGGTCRLEPVSWTALAADEVTARHRPEGVQVRTCRSDEDWAALAEFDDRGEVRRSVRARQRALTGEGHGVILAAWAGSRIVGSAGVLVCDGPDGRRWGRMQDVQTAPDWRCRGVAGTLIAEAHRHGRRLGARRTVIVAETEGRALQIYRHLGFEDAGESWWLAPRSADAPAA